MAQPRVMDITGDGRDDRFFAVGGRRDDYFIVVIYQQRAGVASPESKPMLR